jgi:hypothetical protein
MYQRFTLLALLASIATSPAAFAQQPQRYAVPRTEDGHPDFQGVWATKFVTMLERVPGVENLVVSPEQAQALALKIRSMLPAVIDPQVQLDDVRQLAMVKGEYRTSVIVEPPNGRLPYTKAGMDLAGRIGARDSQKFDNPEERPLSERCLENLGYAPIRTVPVFLPRQIVQTRDHVLLLSEDAVGLRIIHLAGQPRPDSLRSDEGYSVGRWEGDTLVVQTTHFRAEDPARTVAGRPILLTPRTKITERFTRASATELFYQFTVEDPELYTQPWTGEFSLTPHDGPLYEYACHEGNYSLPNTLRGGQAAAARAEENK